MYLKGSLIVFLLMFLLAGAKTQEISHQVLVPAASLVDGSSISYSQTVGETMVKIITDFDYVLTQGFQQPRLRRPPDTTWNGTGVEVYPNPMEDFLKVELFGDTPREFKIIITNITGTLVYQDRIKFIDRYFHIKEIPVSELIRGQYFIRVMSTDGNIIRTFKLEKM